MRSIVEKLFVQVRPREPLDERRFVAKCRSRHCCRLLGRSRVTLRTTAAVDRTRQNVKRRYWFVLAFRAGRTSSETYYSRTLENR